MQGLRSVAVLTTCLVLAAVAVAFASAAPSGAESAGATFLRVPRDPAGVQTLARTRARVVARYRGFTLVEAQGTDAERLRRAGATPRATPGVRIHGRTVRPGPAGRALERSAGLAVVQFAGPVKDAWLERLRATGARVVTYAAPDGYLVSFAASAADGLDALGASDPAVRGVAQLGAAKRVHPGVARTGRVRVAVQTLSGSAGEAARAAAVRSGRRLRGATTVGTLRTEFVALDAAAVPGLAADPGVVSIEPYRLPHLLDERAAQIVAGNLVAHAPTGPGYLSWLASHGLDTAPFDFTVDVTDEGLDTGTIPTTHDDFFVGGDDASATRVDYLQEQTSDPDARDSGGHGTNVASIATGYNDDADATSGPAGMEDAEGFNYGLGIAPRAPLGATKIFSCAGEFEVATTVTNLAANSYAQGARIANHSWGADTEGEYTVDDREFDALVRDAQPATSSHPAAGNQQMVEVVAAGNAGSREITTGSPSNAKNVIAVGASESVRPIGGADGCEVGDDGADSARDIIDFSSRGPTQDLRTKPDVVAPGTHITGASPQHAGFTGSGTCDAQFAGNPLYSLVSGTSQATPEVTGMAALMRAWYQVQEGAPPSPALTKALMANTAADLAGGSDGASSVLGSAPTPVQGWGRVNMGRVLDGTQRAFVDQSRLLTESGQDVRRAYDVADASRPVRITLAWTDAPGPTTGVSYVNDLDLEVQVGGTTYRGNVLAGGLSVAGGAPDPRNNVESVFLPPGTQGRVRVRVVAANIAGDGVPNVNADATDQDFALVVGNAAAVAAPYLAPGGAPTLNAGGDGDGTLEPGEPVAIAQPLRNDGDGPATGVSARVTSATGGATFSGGQVSYPDIPAGGSAVNGAPLSAAVAPNRRCGEVAHLTVTAAANGEQFPIPVTVGTGRRSAYRGWPVPLARPPIPENAAGLTSALAVTQPGLVKDIDVHVNITHDRVGDLVVDVVAPDGTTVRLANRPGGPANTGDGLATVFDDAAGQRIGAAGTAPPYAGRFRPTADQLARLAGVDQRGTWRLRVRDLDVAGSVGALEGWTAHISTAECPPATPEPVPPPPEPKPTPDVRAPVFALVAPRTQRRRTVLRRGVAAVVRCDERCEMRVTAIVDRREARRIKLGRVRRTFGTLVRPGLAQGRRTALRVSLASAAKGILRRRRSVTVTLRFRARDAAGNSRTATRRVRILR